MIPSKILKEKEIPSYKDKISKLKNELDIITASTYQESTHMDITSASNVAELRSKISNRRREYGNIIADIEQLENDSYRRCAVSEEDIDCLKEFFPDVNIRRIKDINKFHSDIEKILEKDRNTELVQLRAKVSPIEQELKSLYSKLGYLGFNENVSQAKMEQYAGIKHEIQNLQNEIESFQKEENLKKDLSTARNNLLDQEDVILERIKNKLNRNISILNNSIQNGKWEPPILHFSAKMKGYGLETSDTGSGSSQAHIMLFDIALAQVIGTPLLAYDTYFFHEMEHERTEDFLRMFEKLPTQIFIALDGDGCYNSCSTLIENRKVLHLTREDTLYGTLWGRKSQ